jgi:hypothetical protein
MKAYVTTTAVIFGLVTVVHVWRAIVEPHVATDLPFILITAAAALLCLWACRLLWLASRP